MRIRGLICPADHLHDHSFPEDGGRGLQRQLDCRHCLRLVTTASVAVATAAEPELSQPKPATARPEPSSSVAVATASVAVATASQPKPAATEPESSQPKPATAAAAHGAHCGGRARERVQVPR